MLSIVVAVSTNGVIGHRGQLPWHLPADLKHFKDVTEGHAVIMGRKTFESIGRPLPNRRNIVVTRQEDYKPASAEASVGKPAGVEFVHSIEEALALCHPDPALDAGERPSPEVFLIGGAELYRQMFDRTDRIYLTRIHEDFAGDVFFPELGPEWKEISKQEGIVDGKNAYPHTFLIYERK